jgi:aminoglycoside 6'-N-acetyltransferase
MLEIYTARLLLRDLVGDDWRAIDAMSRAPEVTCFQTWLRVDGEAEARQWVERAIYHNQLPAREAYNLAVVRRDTQATIGWLGWGRPSDPAQGDYSFGYALLPSAWGCGYMTEALQAAVGYMFDRLAASRVVGECVARNVASARVMEQAGLTRAAEWDEPDEATGTVERHYRYIATQKEK